MSGLFGSPKIPNMPAPATPPPPPTIDQAVQAQGETDLLRMRRGAASSMLAGNTPGSPSTMPASRLLGQ
jgi:hypothetical protein